MLRKLLAIIVLVLVSIAVFVWRSREAAEDSPATRLATEPRTFDTNDPLQRACDLPERVLVRIRRGHHPVHSEDVTTVPHFPNYSGSFSVTSHSGPWDYVQTIPLVLYGPAHIAKNGPLDEFASITDVYPTVGSLVGIDLPRRSGNVLGEAIVERGSAPRLIVTVVWDGVGRNTLERHPDSWPNLEKMEREGTSFLLATVGSSPSITPATHSSLGTGAFPQDHGVTAIEMRTEEGDIRSAFAGKDPSDLDLTTFADDIDRAPHFGNVPKVGMLAWKSWHMGMLGHGTAAAGGDADDMAIIGPHGDVTGNAALYATPDYLVGRKEILQRHARQLDASDGERDGEWRGRDPLEMHDNPAWVSYQRDLMIEMLDRGGYGDDEVPDLFVTNFKVTDIVSHQLSMDSPDEALVLEAQDAALGELVRYLEETVGDEYVVIVTADHGNTPSPQRSGAWPIQQGKLQEDVDAHFDVPEGRSLIEQTTAVGPFLDEEVARDLEVSSKDVARFLNGYTIRDNWRDAELPKGYEERGDEHVFAAAFPSDRIGEVMDCAFGGKPPEEIQA